jgi:hypothetical protein
MRGLATTSSAAPRRESCPRAHRGRAAAPRRVEVELTPQGVERIAARVAQMLGESREEPALISAGELALRLKVERPWVYRHRELLGGIRIGSGPKAPWRFDYAAALKAMRDLQSSRGGGECRS